MKIKPVKHDKRGVLWCGPAVLSAVSGRGTAHIHEILEAITGRKSVKGVSRWALKKAADQLGFELQTVADYLVPSFTDKTTRPTLVQFVKQHRATIAATPVIVNVTGHYVVLSGRSFLDSSNEQPIPFRKAKYRRSRVAMAWAVRRNGALTH